MFFRPQPRKLTRPIPKQTRFCCSCVCFFNKKQLFSNKKNPQPCEDVAPRYILAVVSAGPAFLLSLGEKLLEQVFSCFPPETNQPPFCRAAIFDLPKTKLKKLRGLNLFQDKRKAVP